MIPKAYLRCCCCDGKAVGRHWFNRDVGYGLCDKCIDVNLKGSSLLELTRMAGYRGFHYGILKPLSPLEIEMYTEHFSPGYHMAKSWSWYIARMDKEMIINLVDARIPFLSDMAKMIQSN